MPKSVIPYANATSGDKALGDIQKLLTAFGCNKFGNWTDNDKDTVGVQFEHRGRVVQIEASARGWASWYLTKAPYSSQRRGTRQEYELKALRQGNIAVYSMLRDWIKGQFTAIESGILSFDAAFLGQIMLPSGKTVMEHMKSEKLLAAPEEVS